MEKKRVLIVGAGFYGAVLARELTDGGCRVHLVEKRDHIAGNCFTRYAEEAGCHQHLYGPHIFHTSSDAVWNYLNRFCSFNSFVNRQKSISRGRLFSLPINLMTLYEVYGVKTPGEARRRLEASRMPIENPENLEDWCLSQIGPDLYELLIKGYTIKQWGKSPRELPAWIIKRLPVRFNYDDNYYRDRYQGIPIGGYTSLFERLLAGIPIELKVDFLVDRDEWIRKYDHVVYTGPIDAFFDYEAGVLEYRSLRFESELLDVEDYQGNAIINYGDADVAHTRIVEHKHFDMDYSKGSTVITREYPQNWNEGRERFYPVGTKDNLEIYQNYRRLAKEAGLPVTFGGRLGQYKYFDMHQVVAAALTKSRQLLERNFDVEHDGE